MGKDEQPEEVADIQVAPPYVEAEDDFDGGGRGAKGPAKMALDKPRAVVLKVKTRYKNLDNRDKMAVLIGVLVVVMVIVMMSIWSTGGGIGGPVVGTEIRPVSDWNMDALTDVHLTGEEENTNLAGQETPYLVPLAPAPGEIYFLTELYCQVNWADETTPPTSAPAIGYTNQPDGFQLIIRIHDSVGEWQSDLVFNAIGAGQDISLPINVGEYLGGPIAVANRQGANYLPQGYVESIRVDFIVFTEECGPWTPSDPLRPTIGDGGNHFTFDWTAVYKQADSTQEP